MKYIKTAVKQPVIYALPGALFLCMQPSLVHAADALPRRLNRELCLQPEAHLSAADQFPAAAK